METNPPKNVPQQTKQTTLNPMTPLPKIVDDSSLRVSRPAFLSDYSNAVQEYDFSSTDNFLSKLRDTESQITADRRSQGLQTELQNTKLLINTLSAKFELLQDQSRNENNNFRDFNRELEKCDRQSKDAIDHLNRKLDQESKRVQLLVEEISKFRQNELSQEHLQRDQLKQMQSKVEQLTARLEGYVQQTNQVGANLNSASTQLQIEARRNEETIKAVQMHEHALTTLTSNMDSSVNAFTNKIQMAANDLFQRIDGEAKARKGLEESIRQDAMEFRRMIERHIAERVESVKSYTQVQGEHDRQAIETVSNSFNAKLKRLEDSTGGSLEQIGGLLNQRVSVVENAIEETEVSYKRLESRLMASVAESVQVLESMMAKRDTNLEQRLKEVSKSALNVQKSIHDSISISEKTLGKKVKGVEDVLRAEISARLEIDHKLAGFKTDAQSNFESQQSQIHKLLEMVEQGKRDQEKTLELVKTVAQQITKSQDRWVGNFEGEIVKLNDALEKQSSSTYTSINQTKDELLQVHDTFVTETQENHAQVVLDLQESKLQSEKIKTILSDMEANIQTMAEEVEQKFAAKYVQLDTTLEAFKLEFAARPTKDALEDRIAELEAEMEVERKRLKEKISNLAEKQKDFVEVGVIDSLDKEVDQFKASNRLKITDLESLIAKTTNEWQNFKSGEQVQRQEEIKSQMERILGKQDEMADQIEKHETSFEEFMNLTNTNIMTTKESILSYENRLESFNTVVDESKLLIANLDEKVKLEQGNAKNRDIRITALSEEVNGANETLSRKIIESSDKQSKVTLNINHEIQKLSEQLLQNKSQTEKSSDQLSSLRETVDVTSKSTKQNITELNKRLEEFTTSTQSQLETNSRKISLLTLNLESSHLQNQNDHALIQEDLAFTKKSMMTARDEAQEQKNEEIEAQIQRSNMLLEEARKDVESISRKTQTLERNINEKIVEVNESSEKRAMENASQVDHLRNLVAKTQEQLNSKVDKNGSTIDQVSKEVKLIKAEVNQVEADTAKIKGEMKKIVGEVEATKSSYAYKSSKSSKFGTTPRAVSRPEGMNDEVSDKGLPVQHSSKNLEF